MSTVAETEVCEICGSAMETGSKECGHCHASRQWQDYARAVAFARTEISTWCQRGMIRPVHQQAMDKQLLMLRESIEALAKSSQAFLTNTGLDAPGNCWRCGRPVAGFYSYCNTCGATLGKAADTLRYLAFLDRQVTLAAARELTLPQAHACSADVREHIAALRSELERTRLSSSELAAEKLKRLRDLKSGAGQAAMEEVVPV